MKTRQLDLLWIWFMNFLSTAMQRAAYITPHYHNLHTSKSIFFNVHLQWKLFIYFWGKEMLLPAPLHPGQMPTLWISSSCSPGVGCSCPHLVWSKAFWPADPHRRSPTSAVSIICKPRRRLGSGSLPERVVRRCSAGLTASSDDSDDSGDSWLLEDESWRSTDDLFGLLLERLTGAGLADSSDDSDDSGDSWLEDVSLFTPLSMSLLDRVTRRRAGGLVASSDDSDDSWLIDDVSLFAWPWAWPQSKSTKQRHARSTNCSFIVVVNKSPIPFHASCTRQEQIRSCLPSGKLQRSTVVKVW